jgi:hypothetical protein
MSYLLTFCHAVEITQTICFSGHMFFWVPLSVRGGVALHATRVYQSTTFDATDFRDSLPRFTPEARRANTPEPQHQLDLRSSVAVPLLEVELSLAR